MHANNKYKLAQITYHSKRDYTLSQANLSYALLFGYKYQLYEINGLRERQEYIDLYYVGIEFSA